MSVQTFGWILVAAFSTLSGALFVGFLTSKPWVMSRYLAGTMASLFIAEISVWSLPEGAYRLLTACLGACAMLLGYWIAAKRVLSREDPRVVPAITRAEGDRGSGHPATVYLTHGEPEAYDPIGWINQFREFDERGLCVDFQPHRRRGRGDCERRAGAVLPGAAYWPSIGLGDPAQNAS